MQIFKIIDSAIAALGTYERGAHINDPYIGMIGIGAASATVAGPMGWLCDGLATVLMVGLAKGGPSTLPQPK